MQSLDEFLRTSLKGYKVPPSESEKSKFLEDVNSVTKKSGAYKKWLYTGITGVMLLIIGLVIYFSLPRPQSQENKTYCKNQPQYAGSKPGIPVHKYYPQPSVSFQRQTSHAYPSEAIPETYYTSLSPARMQGNPSFLLIPVDDMPSSIAKVDTNDISGNKPAPFINDSLKNPESAIAIATKKTEGSPKTRKFAAGVYYEPEWMFNLLKEDKNMMVNNFGLKGEYFFGPWSIGTGIGLSLTKGTNEIVIGYNDYLGKYKGLDSITFKWNAYHSHLIPTYYYSDKDYYSSLLKLDYYNYNRSYLYLQVPLILGYDFLREKGFTLGVRIGPTLSILLQTTPKRDGFNHGNDRILQINDITPERIETSYQLNAGIEAGIRLARSFELEAEPIVSYYFNSVYEKGGTVRKPWSAGVKISLLIINE